MGRWALAVSFSAHLAVLALLLRLSPPTPTALPLPEPLTVEVLATPAPEAPAAAPQATPLATPMAMTDEGRRTSHPARPSPIQPPEAPAPVPPPPESKALTMRAPAPAPVPAPRVLDPNAVANLIAPKAPPPQPEQPSLTKIMKAPGPVPAPEQGRNLADLFTSGPIKRADNKDKTRFFSDYTPADMNEGFAASGFFVDDVPSPIEVPGPAKKENGLGKAKGGGRYHIDRPGFTADVAEDGTVAITDIPAMQAKVLPCLHSKKELRRCADNLQFPLLRVHFDINDWAERMAGNDPYLYEKKKYLDATREERMKMARAALRERLRDAVRAAPALLRELWRDGTVSAAERRRMIFQLWDECAEEGDPDILVASRAFRGTVLAFVRRQLRADGPDAYPAAELEALNKERLSRQRFDPYSPEP